MGQAPAEVTDKKGRPVRAKMLTDASGNVVRDPVTGMPLVVDEDFDINRAIGFGRSLANIPVSPFSENPEWDRRVAILDAMKNAFRRRGPLDMQRSYNGMVGGGKDEFVSSFRPAASYVFGAVGRAAGLTPLEIKLGAGLYNLWTKYDPWDPNPEIDTSGPLFNPPRNDRWIDEGAKGHDSGRFDKPVSTEPIQLPDRADAKIGPDFAHDWNVPSEGKLDRAPLQNPARSGAISRPPSTSETAVTETPTAGSGLPPQVISSGNYLNANGVPVTHRSMYLASVYGPQRVVDAINNGQVGSLPAPLPDDQTQQRIRSWVQGWHGIGPMAVPENAAPASGGMSGPADDGPDDWIVPSDGQQSPF